MFLFKVHETIAIVTSTTSPDQKSEINIKEMNDLDHGPDK